MIMFLTGAYGRIYTSQEKLFSDWKEGRDFMLVDTGQYCSIRDVPVMDHHGYTRIVFMQGNKKMLTLRIEDSSNE
jgi:hypothetical protein